MKSIFSKKFTSILGQTIVEYSLVVGIVIAVVMVLSPMVKQTTQGMVKVVADEVGIQNYADGGAMTNIEMMDRGGLVSSQTAVTVDQKKARQEWRAGTTHSVQANYEDQLRTEGITKSNLGVRDN